MDFSKLKYNVTTVPTGKRVTDVYPELLDYKEYQDPERDMLLRIAFLATDENSPFLLKDRDHFEKRIEAIFEFLKLNDDMLFSSIVLNKNSQYASIVNRFFIQVDNLAYTMWSNALFNFHMIGIALRQPPNMDNLTSEMEKRAKLQNQQNQIHKDLVKLEAQVFPDAQVRKIARDEVAKILTLPEKYAQDKQVI